MQIRKIKEIKFWEKYKTLFAPLFLHFVCGGTRLWSSSSRGGFPGTKEGLAGSRGFSQ